MTDDRDNCKSSVQKMCKFVSQETCLSPGVLSLCQLGLTSSKLNILTSHGTLNWEYMKDLLEEGGGEVAVKDAEWYKSSVTKIAPVICYAAEIYQRMLPNDFSNKFVNYLLWTHNHQTFLRSFELLQNEDEVSVPLSMLILTACIERALGNVCLLKGGQVPSLLKDLLSLPHLSEILGTEVVDTLKIMIGPPFSLNLRNILWHGFFAPSEVDKRFAYFLLMISVSVGERLAQKSVSIVQIPCREMVSFTQTSVWEGMFPCIEDVHVRILREIFFQSYLVLPQMKPYWEAALCKYVEKSYGESLAVTLPQLENCLRVLFVSINNCPERLLTAESSVLYTTFDEILEEFVGVNQKNLVRKILGDSLMELLFDILIHPEGPRIRDRLSHGEADFYNIPCVLATFVLCSAAVLCCQFVPENSIFLQNEYVKKLKDCISSYHSYFHSTSLLRNKIVCFVACLTNWHLCPIPEEGCLEVQKGLSSDSSYQFVLCLEAVTCNYQLRFLGHGLTYDVASLTRGQDYIKQWYPQVVYRPRVEAEVTSVLRKIVHHALYAADHVYKALCSRYELWNGKQLRSRQRTNYMRLLSSKETMGSGLFVVFLIVLSHCHNLNKIALLCTKTKDDVIRLLKRVLQYVENMDSLTDPDKNNWEKSCKITSDFFITVADFCKNSVVHKDLDSTSE